MAVLTLVMLSANPLLAKGKGNKHIDPIVTISKGTIVEADDETVLLEFTVSLSAIPTRAVIVRYDTSAITAIEGIDYLRTNGQINFPARKTNISRTIQVPVVGDYEPEDDETFDIFATRIINGVESPPVTFRATIFDNDKTELTNGEMIANLRQIVYTKSVEIKKDGSPYHPRMIGLDIGNDGDQDMLVVYDNPYDGATAPAILYINDNTTETGWTAVDLGVSTNAGYGSMVIGDFNGDGLDDVFNFNPFGDNVIFTQSAGSLVASPIADVAWRSTYSKGYQKQMVKHSVGDIDNDGDVDVFVVRQSDPYYYNTNGHLWFINDGTGNFTIERRMGRFERQHWYSTALSSTIADFDNDGANDILLGTNNYQKNSTRYGRSNQKFGNNNMLLNGDGTLKGAVEKLANVNHSTKFATHTDVLNSDLNGDGNLDIVAITMMTTLSDVDNQRVEVRFGNGDGTFYLSQELSQGTQGDARISLEDVNGDGNLDIVATPMDQHWTYYNKKGYSTTLNRLESVVYVNLGNGTFAEDPSVTIDQVSIETGMLFMTDDDTYTPVELQQ